MDKKFEKKASEAVFTFTAQAEEWTSAQKKEFHKLAAKLNVPGFRKGHVPDAIAKGRINPAEVLHEAMFTLVNKAYAEAIKEEKITPFAQPQLNVSKISETELECTVTVALPPSVKLGEYKGFGIEKEAVSVSDEELGAEIQKKLAEHATMIVKEGAAAMGDSVIIDFKGYIDDIPFDGGEAKAYELKLGSNAFIPGFEEKLVGIQAEEERTIDVTFPENYVENLAGKAAKFVVKCHDVKQTVLPELNDEFVDELEIENVKTVDAYKAKLSADLTASKEKAASTRQLDAIVNKAIENAEVSIADSIVTEEAKTQIDSIRKQVESNGLKFEDYLKINGIDEAKLLADKKAEAEHNIKGMLVIEEICRKENIVVDSKALNDKYESLAKMYNMKLEDVRKALEPNKNDLLRNLKNELFSKFMLANNVLSAPVEAPEETPAAEPATEE